MVVKCAFSPSPLATSLRVVKSHLQIIDFSLAYDERYWYYAQPLTTDIYEVSAICSPTVWTRLPPILVNTLTTEQLATIFTLFRLRG